MPAISTNIPGITEIIKHGETGLLVPPEDTNALANAIRQLLNDSKLRQSLRRRGRVSVERKFDVRQNVVQLRDLLLESKVADEPVAAGTTSATDGDHGTRIN